MKTPALVLVLAFLGILMPQPLQALDLTGFSGRFGVGIIQIVFEEEDVSPPPTPVSVSTLGGSLMVSFADGYFLGMEPALDLLWTNYQWFDGRRAVPTEYENDSMNNAFVLGFLIDLPVVASFRINDNFGGSFGLGPAFLLGLPLPAMQMPRTIRNSETTSRRYCHISGHKAGGSIHRPPSA
jgi:hypothetical protein